MNRLLNLVLMLALILPMLGQTTVNPLGSTPAIGNSDIKVGAVTDDKASLHVKPSATVVATSNTALSGLLTIDGVTTAAGSIVLATAQSTGSQNGPWIVASGSWTRPTWYPSGGTTQAFQFITEFVRLGTVNAGSVWRITLPATAITIDSTSTTWTMTSFGSWMATSGVSSVFGRTGVVVAATNDYNFNQLAGSLAGSQLPALTNDVTTSAGSVVTSVKQAHWTETAITNASSPYTVLSADTVISCNATAGAVVINLPAATGTGREVVIKKTDSSSNSCTPTRSSSDLIDGATTVSITVQYGTVKLIDTASAVWSRTLAIQVGGDATGLLTNLSVTKLNGTAFSGSSGNLVGFGAANIPTDTGVASANVVTSASAASAAKQVCVASGTSKSCSYIDFPDMKIIPAANCVNAVASSALSSSSTGMPAACRGGSNNLNGVLQPIPNTGGTAYFDFELPGDWDTSVKPYIAIYYASGANTSGTVIWTVSSACTKQDGSITDDPTWVAESAMGTQTMANANRMWAQNAQLAGTLTNCIAGSTMYFKIVLSGTATSAINLSKITITTPRLLTVQAN